MYRALATVNAFARDGWDVTVLTATRETYERLTGSDPATEQSIDKSVRVVRIPFDPARGEEDLERWSRSRVASPLLWSYLRWLASSAKFPEGGYGHWTRALKRAAERIHAEKPVDLVVGTANPNVDFVPGVLLHQKAGVPYVMDYRDGWSLDVYTGRRANSRRSRAGRIERRMLRGATEAWFVNEPIRAWHEREYPENAHNFHVVANGWDPEFLQLTPRARLGNDGALTFGYLGTIYGPMPLQTALEGWRLARSRSALIARSRLEFRGRLGHFAEPDPHAAELLAAFHDDDVSYLGPVSKTTVAEAYGALDALLLIVSKSAFVTSGKVFEYAATGLPIAAVHHPETGATSVLEGRPAWFPVREVTAEEVARVIEEAGEHALGMSGHAVRAAQEWAQPLARDEQLAPRVKALRALVESRS